MNLLRQGDVLLRRLPSPPPGSPHVHPVAAGSLHSHNALPPPPSRRTVLAEGEATGHAHVLDGLAAIHAAGAQRFLHVQEPGARLVHEEHATIAVSEGWWEVIQQREYDPTIEGRHERWVAD